MIQYFMAFLQFYNTITSHLQNSIPNFICLCWLTDYSWWFSTICLLEYSVCSAVLGFSNQPLNCNKQNIKRLLQPARKGLRKEIIATYTLSKMLLFIRYADHLPNVSCSTLKEKKKNKQVKRILMAKSWSKCYPQTQVMLIYMQHSLILCCANFRSLGSNVLHVTSLCHRMQTLSVYYNEGKTLTAHLDKRRGTRRKGTCFPCEMVIARGTENWKEHKRHYIWTKLFKTAVPKLRSRD